MNARRSCRSCSESLGAEDVFCGACGTPAGTPPAAASTPTRGPGKAVMLVALLLAVGIAVFFVAAAKREPGTPVGQPHATQTQATGGSSSRTQAPTPIAKPAIQDPVLPLSPPEPVVPAPREPAADTQPEPARPVPAPAAKPPQVEAPPQVKEPLPVEEKPPAAEKEPLQAHVAPPTEPASAPSAPPETHAGPKPEPRAELPRGPTNGHAAPSNGHSRPATGRRVLAGPFVIYETDPRWRIQLESVQARDGTARFAYVDPHVQLMGQTWGLVVTDPRPDGAQYILVARIDDDSTTGARTMFAPPKALERLAQGEKVTVVHSSHLSADVAAKLPSWNLVHFAPGQLDAAGRLAAQNLRRIGLALFAYQEDLGAMPPAIVFGPDGKPWHSWRVLILRYLGYEDLADEYRFDQPWNSKANRAVLGKMPREYRDQRANDSAPPRTTIVALSGDGARMSNQRMRTAGPGANLKEPWARGSVPPRDAPEADTVLVGIAPLADAFPWIEPRDAVGVAPTNGRRGLAFDYGWPGQGGTFGLFLFEAGQVERIEGPAPPDLVRALRGDHGARMGEGALRRLPMHALQELTFEIDEHGQSTARFVEGERKR